MVHIWVRAEQREHEERVGITPQGASELLGNGFQVSVEVSGARVIRIDDYRDAGCQIVAYSVEKLRNLKYEIFRLKRVI